MGLNFEVCLAYLDDIIVFNRDLDSHFERLEIMFQRLREAQLKLKPSQCQMLRKQVSFRGYTVSQAGVGTDPDSRRRQRLACPAKSPPKPCFCGPLPVSSTVCTELFRHRRAAPCPYKEGRPVRVDPRLPTGL